MLPELLGCLLAAALLPIAYSALHRIEDEQRRRRIFLVASVVTNLGLLGFFKYYNFFIGSMQEGAAALGLDVALLHLDIVLPVGISFYTFQTMSLKHTLCFLLFLILTFLSLCTLILFRDQVVHYLLVPELFHRKTTPFQSCFA